MNKRINKLNKQFGNEQPQLPHTGYVRLKVVLFFIPVSESTWWLGIKNGIYPKGRKLGGNSTAWKAEEIRDLIGRIDRDELL